MLISNRDELLIQRCVDEELSVAETQALLARLDSLDGGWKSLACGLLEDRMCRRLMKPPDSFEAVSPVIGKVNDASGSTPTVAGQAVVGRTVAGTALRTGEVVRHWWSHPVTSLTLCAAIAFVGGMLIPKFAGNDVRSVADRSNVEGQISYPVGNSGAGRESYQLQIPGGRPLDVPVYHKLEDLYESDRNHPVFSRSHEEVPMRWLVVPAGDEKSMVFPVSEDPNLELQ